MQVRAADGSLLVEASADVPDGDQLCLTIPAAATDGRPAGRYSYDVQLTLMSGEVRSIQRGIIDLVADVTSDALPVESTPLPHGRHLSPEQTALLDLLPAAATLSAAPAGSAIVRHESGGWGTGEAGMSEAEVASRISDALADIPDAAAVEEVVAPLRRALPAGRVRHVGQGRDYPTLIAAYDALAALIGSDAPSPTARYRLHLWGDIVESSTVYALDHVDVIWEDGARLIIQTDDPGAGLRAVGTTVTFAARSRRRGWIIRRSQGVAFGPGNQVVYSSSNGIAGARNTFVGLVALSECPNLPRGYGIEAADTTLIDVESRASGNWRGYGLGAGTGGVYGVGCDFYGGVGPLAIGAVLSGAKNRFHDCRAYGGPSTGAGECFGWWIFSYESSVSTNTRLTNCVGYGGDAPWSPGISTHKSATATLVNCVGIGGPQGGPGLFTWGQPDNYAAHLHIGCTYIGIAPTQGHGAQVSGPCRDVFNRCTFVASPAGPAAGAVLEAFVGNTLGDQRVARFDLCAFYGGGVAPTLQPATIFYTDSPALRIIRNAGAYPTEDGGEFIGCVYRSNPLSPAIAAVGDVNPMRIIMAGGYAASGGAQPAILGDAAIHWAGAKVFGMTLKGGVQNVTTAAPTLEGNNVFL